MRGLGAGGRVSVTRGFLCDTGPVLGGAALGTVLAAVTKLRERTGGGLTGAPAKAARIVGLTPGCGMICACSSCCGVSRMACRATGSPLLKACAGTAVVATVLYA